MEKFKSKLQERLETEGWELLGNDDPWRKRINEKQILLNSQKGDAELKKEFLEKGFKEVMVAEAYDLFGKSLSKLRAIYVKR